MNRKTWILFLTLLTLTGFSGSAVAELSVIGAAAYDGENYNLIYDEDQGLVWLDYTSRGNRWDAQAAWADGLNDPGTLTCHLNPGVHISWKGQWRLPETTDGARRHGYDGATTAGFNITTSEMGYLYYVSLGNLGYYDTDGNPGPGWFPDSDWGPKNTAPFENLQPDMYWSGTEYGIAPAHAWSFNFAFGDQGNIAFKCSYPYVGIAVRSGKVEGR